MNRSYRYYGMLALLSIVLMACVTKKKRNETSKLGKMYQNTTAYYNGYWNSNEIMKEGLLQLRQANVDNYNQILEIEDYVSVDNPKMVKAEMDKIIEKVTTVAQLHEASDWVDDCYVMMARAQYVKQEYETAEETLKYFQEDFNPNNPYGRNYKSKKPTGKALKKMKADEKAEKERVRKEEKEKKDDAKKELAKTKEEEKKDREKQRALDKKNKEKERKAKAKERKKSGSKKSSSPKTTSEKLPSATTTVSKDEVKKPESKKVETTKPEEEAPYVPEVKKIEEDQTAYSQGILWLAKTYVKRQNWFSSEMLLNKLEAGNVGDDLRSDLYATYANLYIKQERYSDALAKLELAIEHEDNRQLRARYSFIAGQISQQLNDNEKAVQYFAAAKKYTNNTKMEFMSVLAVAKNGIISGKTSKSEAISDLLKMAKEDKYIEVQDQIYFTLAEIELSQDNEKEAIEYFKKSLANNNSDQKLKAEAYYKIGDLYFKNQQYLFASNYFDSTLTLMTIKDERYPLVKKYVGNLKDIAYNISLIQENDTLLYFADLSPEQQRKEIPPYLERNSKSPAATTATPITKDIKVASSIDFGNSAFFAYNSNTKEKGKEDFNKIWGKRTLEDDWRRSNKALITNDSEGSNPSNTEEKPEENKPTMSDEYEKFVKSLPNNPVRKQEANDKIQSALFALGKLFRDKLENFEKSAETLEEMHKRYGPTPNEMDSYFYLYLDYIDLANAVKAEEYKSKITRKYPDSKYTAILTDPNYFAKAQKRTNEPEEYYKAVYALFEKGEYAKALDAIDRSSTKMPTEDNPYLAKLALLKAMCLGNKEGKEAYVKALNDVIAAFPNTPEQSKAKEIMRFLGGDKSAFAVVEDVDKIFEYDETESHYVVVLTYALDETKHVNVKVAISDYNKKNFKVERLQLGDASLNIEDNSQIILIRKFENAAKAMEYYRKVEAEKADYTGDASLNIDVFPISQRNYRKMLSERSAVAYRVFFDRNYLKK